MAKQKPAWLSFLPPGVSLSKLSLDEVRAVKEAHALLTERVEGPECFADCTYWFRGLLFFGIVSVAENSYPPLTRAWKELEKLFMNDPTFEDGVFVQSWILMDFPFGPQGQTALDYFEDFLKGTDGATGLQQFIKAARGSRLGLHQDIGRTKSVAKFRELLSGKVTAAVPAVDEYGKGEILLARVMTYGDQSFIFGDPKGFPKEMKTHVEDMVRRKLCYFDDQKTPEAQFETFMKLAGPYWMSCVTKNDAVDILDPDHYRTYLDRHAAGRSPQPGPAEASRTRPGKGKAYGKASAVYKLKVTLLDTEPPIWRPILVQADVTLAKLSTIINAAMGWEGYHLHEFQVGKAIWGPPPRFDDDFGYDVKDHAKTTLARTAPRKGSAFKYQYDGGDCWMHEVRVEDVLEPDPKRSYPVCLEGARACPPEDCGGIPGFENLLAAMASRKHPDHKNLTEWLGGKFDPEKFEIGKVNESLRKIGMPPKPRSPA